MSFSTLVQILQLEAENLPEVSHKYEISAVPTFLLFKVTLWQFQAVCSSINEINNGGRDKVFSKIAQGKYALGLVNNHVSRTW